MLFYNRLNHVYYTVKMKIFITGVAGFLGCHLAKKLTELGHKVSGVDNMIGGEISNIPKNITFTKGNCENNELMNKLTKGVDIVYHCAATAHEGLKTGEFRHCRRCDQNKPFLDFADETTKRGYRTYCNACSKDNIRKKKTVSIRATGNQNSAQSKICPNCQKKFPLDEFVDKRNESGRRRLCGDCKAISVRKQEAWNRKNRR